jgi:hypothetical protein
LRGNGSSLALTQKVPFEIQIEILTQQSRV